MGQIPRDFDAFLTILTERQMHTFGVGFQLWSNRHIYRGLGKSELCMVFLNVPYEGTLKIGGLDGDLVTFLPGAWDRRSIFS